MISQDSKAQHDLPVELFLHNSINVDSSFIFIKNNVNNHVNAFQRVNREKKMYLKHGGITKKPMYLKSEDSSRYLENLRHLKHTINIKNLCLLKLKLTGYIHHHLLFCGNLPKGSIAVL